MTSRRSFLASVAAAIAGAAALELDPERALWVPGKKLISVPAPIAFAPFGPPFIVSDGFVLVLMQMPIRPARLTVVSGGGFGVEFRAELQPEPPANLQRITASLKRATLQNLRIQDENAQNLQC